MDGQTVTKPGKLISKQADIHLRQKPPYVSRGGVKLQKALQVFSLTPKDKVCLDIGSSTGGFTDCMLQEGAKKVYAIDSGSHQMDAQLRQNPKICLH